MKVGVSQTWKRISATGGELAGERNKQVSLVSHMFSRTWGGNETDTHFELPELATSENTAECNVTHVLGRILISNLSQVGFSF